MSDPWNPSQYHRFQVERQRPFHDLLTMLEEAIEEAGPTGFRDAGPRVLDLGCGTGELTLLLHERLAASVSVGLDPSVNMLKACAEHEVEGVSFLRGDVEHLPFEPGGLFDVIFSNAALHWAPDHQALVSALAGRLASGGMLAVQVPANHEHPSHVLAAELAGHEPYATALGGYVRVSPVLAAAKYALLLARLGLVDIRVRQEVYVHTLAAPEDVVEWMRGTTLTDYERRLTPELFEAFLAAYRPRLMDVLPDERPHVFPFQRILFRATRPATG